MHFETTWERKRFQARTLFKDAWVCTSDSNYYITLQKDKDPDYEKKLSQWVKGCCKLLRTGATERLLEILSVESDSKDLTDLPISRKSKQRIQNSIEAPNQMADHIKERVSNVLNTDGKDEKQKAFDKIIPKILISSTMTYAAKTYYEQYGREQKVLGSN